MASKRFAVTGAAVLLMSVLGGCATVSSVLPAGQPVPEAERFKFQVFSAYQASWTSLTTGALAMASLSEANGRADEAALLRAQVSELGDPPAVDAGSFNVSALSGLIPGPASDSESLIDESAVEGTSELLLSGAVSLAGALLSNIKSLQEIQALVSSGASLASALPSQGVNGVAAAASLRPYVQALPELASVQLESIKSAGSALGQLVAFFRSRDIPLPSDVTEALGALSAFGQQ